jgi:16S rRNA (cytosine1402-N4)-methyltransferase
MHVPVLQKEVIKFLAPKPNENFIDCTFGGGGHGLAIIEKILPNGKLLGIERDEEVIRRLKIKNQISKIKNNLILVCDNFANLKMVAEREKFGEASGILFDLGLSSWHLEKSARGFSFLREEFLDMRYGAQNYLTAEKIINEYFGKEIEKILKDYGEERFAKRIAGEIVATREIKPVKTTLQLVEIIKKATPDWYHRQRIHPATRTFQALRIAVNEELENLEKALPQALEILKKEGRLALISFNSLEDRLVKNFLRNNRSRLKILTKKPTSPSLEEIKFNPRSRSAKLRAAVKL